MSVGTYPIDPASPKRHCIRCDKCGFEAVSVATFPGNNFAAERRTREGFALRLHAEGWTAWISRQRRDYCPNCKPTKGHNMRPAAL